MRFDCGMYDYVLYDLYVLEYVIDVALDNFKYFIM